MSIEITNWKALEDMECPKCGCGLLKNEVGYGCCSCSFKIREAKFNDIINSMSRPRRREERDEVEDNLHDLNNL
jgi:hypothetical protein